MTSVIFAGYGHSTPQTDSGKVFCMWYALVGIPLCLIMFQSVGERLNTFVTFLLKHTKKCLRLKNCEVSQTNLIMVATILSSFYLFTGAGVFTHFEDWSYLDAFYYCFITLTTIGFGDYVALQSNNALQDNPEYVTFSLIFILFGLTVISAAMNLLVLRFLTMNTEDEQRDELEAAAAAQTAVRLEGDVITSNGNVVSGAQENPEFNDVTSVCSCSCYNLGRRNKSRYTVTRLPGKISHLLPMHSVSSGKDDNFMTDIESNSVLPFQHINSKRASVQLYHISLRHITQNVYIYIWGMFTSIFLHLLYVRVAKSVKLFPTVNACIICLVYQILFLQSCVNLSIAIYIVELVNKFDDAFGDRRDCVHNTLTCKLFMGNLLHQRSFISLDHMRIATLSIACNLSRNINFTVV